MKITIEIDSTDVEKLKKIVGERLAEPTTAAVILQQAFAWMARTVAAPSEEDEEEAGPSPTTCPIHGVVLAADALYECPLCTELMRVPAP